jgi:KUP system potassium uptake protein
MAAFWPLILASLVYGIMWIWHRGVDKIHETIVAEQMPFKDFATLLDGGTIARVPGTAVFLTRARHETPPVMSWHVKQNRSLHENVLALTLTTTSKPRVAERDRVAITREGDNFWRAEAKFGFIERPDIATVLEDCKMKGAGIDLDDVTYYVGHETIVPRGDHKGLPRWLVVIFSAMGRNAWRISDSLQLPHDHVVEIGREIAI